MPDGYANYALQALGAKGKKALVAWVNDGGHLIAWEGSAEVATRIGASTAVLQMAHTNMPGSLVRIALDETSPLADGVGPFAWAMFEDDPVMAPGRGEEAAVFPDASSEDFFVSGLDSGAEQLGGTSAVVDEAVGKGRATVFTFDPVFRGWADGTQRILWNAIAGPDPFPGCRRAGRIAGASGRGASWPARLPSACLRWRRPSGSRSSRTDARATTERAQRVRGHAGSGCACPEACCS